MLIKQRRNIIPQVRLICGSLSLPLLFCVGCVDVSGGAVEAKWVLRNSLAWRIDNSQSWQSSCRTENNAEVQIDKIKFRLSPINGGEDPCAANDQCLFDCSQGGGTTSFFIPIGSYSISLHAVNPEGTFLDSTNGVITPTPIVRRVNWGELTDLSVYVILVNRD
jgi:hypothetical protein